MVSNLWDGVIVMGHLLELEIKAISYWLLVHFNHVNRKVEAPLVGKLEMKHGELFVVSRDNESQGTSCLIPQMLEKNKAILYICRGTFF